MTITHFIRRRPPSDAWVQLSCILYDRVDDVYSLGLDLRIGSDVIEKTVELGSLMALPEPVALDDGRWLWIDPEARIWYTSNSDPIGDSTRVEVARDEAILEAIDV